MWSISRQVWIRRRRMISFGHPVYGSNVWLTTTERSAMYHLWRTVKSIRWSEKWQSTLVVKIAKKCENSQRNYKSWGTESDKQDWQAWDRSNTLPKTIIKVSNPWLSTIDVRGVTDFPARYLEINLITVAKIVAIWINPTPALMKSGLWMTPQQDFGKYTHPKRYILIRSAFIELHPDKWDALFIKIPQPHSSKVPDIMKSTIRHHFARELRL